MVYDALTNKAEKRVINRTFSLSEWPEQTHAELSFGLSPEKNFFDIKRFWAWGQMQARATRSLS
jgi:hypothetical protein